MLAFYEESGIIRSWKTNSTVKPIILSASALLLFQVYMCVPCVIALLLGAVYSCIKRMAVNYMKYMIVISIITRSYVTREYITAVTNLTENN